MRFLNKIVFINSAHVRYAEIGLNGNVHLIGTQGVGKSTLLRALLFFYNADKQKLGIPREKKPFDDFYFEKSNSYIVYEVVRDESAFCVLVSKHNGRACFNFIDAPYNKDWLVDENGEVTAELKNIRARLGGVFMSVTVDRYEQFRDIIYGNRQSGMRKEFYRFNIAESSRYQNIPRSIQNVFLNSKLDADFIKDTIIQSMDGESSCIDLGYFRNQISEFEQEYKDIGLWFTKNKRGECETRLDADKVVKYYRALLQLQRELKNGCAELNFAYRNTCEQLPIVASDIEKVGEALNSTNRLLGEENEKYNKERDALNSDLTRVKDKLKRCKERQEYYESQNISDVLKKQDQENFLKLERDSLEEKRRLLTRKFESVEEKYRSLLEKVQAKLNEFVQIQKEKINQRQSQLNTDVLNLMDALNKNRSETSKAFDEEISAIDARKKSLENELHSIEKELIRLNYFHPLENEINECKARLAELEKSCSEWKIKKAECKQELSKLLSARDGEIEKNKAAHDESCWAQNARRKELLQNLDELDNLLARQKGSLYEWLSANKPGWENDIGKVVDEESVLYNTELSPALDDSKSLFGVSLNLDEMPVRVRTPEEIAEERRSVESGLDEIKKNLEAFAIELENKNAETDKAIGPKIKKFQDAIQHLDLDLDQYPIHEKRLKNELESLKQRDASEIEKLLANANEKLDGISRKLIEETEAVEKVRTSKEREIKKLEKAFRDRKEELNSEFENYKVDVLAEIKNQEECSREESDEISRARDAELSSKNVDVEALKNIEAGIENVKKLLEEIERNKELVAVYRHEKAEFFDHEQEFREQRSSLELKLSSLKKKFEDRKQKLELQKSAQNEKFQNLKNFESSMKSWIAETEQFKTLSICLEMLLDAGESPCTKNCHEIIEELRNNVYESDRRQKDLRVAVDKFRSRFSSRNTFKFRDELNVDSDYMAFAENLNDFLMNEKINDYRDRTSGRYTDILKRVATEVGFVVGQKAEVEKVIHGVNRDFVEKNFAGVIKSISLRMEESEDQLMRLLLRMQKFHAENQYRMGELTLFSDGDTESVNREVVNLLLHFVKALNDEPTRNSLKLSDAFKLQFRVQENDNDTGWIDKIANVGSEGTDILVKAMVNIMLINVFKTQVSRKFGDFKLHCMMDEIGRLHPKNANGILQFANSRNIYLVNGSPTTQSVSEYRYTYLLEKNSKSETVVRKLMTKVENCPR